MYLSGKNDLYRKCERGGKQAVQNGGNRLTETDKNLLVTQYVIFSQLVLLNPIRSLPTLTEPGKR